MIFSIEKPIISPPHSADKRRALFLAKKMLPEYVFDASKLENNPITFPEVQTLMDSITIGGRKISDVQQVLNIRDAWLYVLEAVKGGSFRVDEATANHVNSLIAREEALEWGSFRTGRVGIAGTSQYEAPPADELRDIWLDELDWAMGTSDSILGAIRLFLWMALNQFYWDGNKRTARLMASGYLLSKGIGVFNIRANDILEFNTKMIAFYDTRRADDIAQFLADKAIAAIE